MPELESAILNNMNVLGGMMCPGPCRTSRMLCVSGLLGGAQQ